MARSRPVTRLFGPVVGLVAWALQFGVVYGFTAIICARGLATMRVFGIAAVPFVIAAATAIALAVTGISILASLRARRRMADDAQPTDRFLNTSTILIGALSLVAIVWTGLPAFLMPACG